MKVAVYISNLNKIGGVEAFAINLCNRTGWDLIFRDYNFNQIKKLKHNSYNEKYLRNTDYDVIILSQANWNPYPEKLTAKYFIQTVHADYKEFKEKFNFEYKKFSKTTHHIAVSQHVKNIFEQVTPYKVDRVIYNLLDEHKKKAVEKNKKLSFITLSRFSKEKGFERMLQMAELMKDEDYIWNIYGDFTNYYGKLVVPKLKQYKQINILGVTNTAKDEICKHDYLVQLSDTEGFCYSIYESLSVNVPVIVTNFDSAKEMVKDGENGYILDMDLSNFDINKIKSVPLIKSFEEKSTEKDWIEFLEQILKQ